VKFIFATTEPEKVIGTIRSRTHHYPFRLVPPAQLLEYLESVCESENVQIAPGVLALVVRAGGGSVRDSLSLLDQLIAGSDGGKVEYELAAALLGFTHAELLNEVVDAFSQGNSRAVFEAVDRVIQTGQDPRRFVEDLLEHLRNLIIVISTGENAKSVLRGIAADEIEKMTIQAYQFGLSELTHAANVVSESLNEMSGATSPKLHLELMCAKVLVPASDATEVGSLARIERLERRIGVSAPAAETGKAGQPAVMVSTPPPAVKVAAAPVVASPAAASSAPAAEIPASAAAPAASAVPAAPAAAPEIGQLDLAEINREWPAVLKELANISRATWVMAQTIKVVGYSDGILTLEFATVAESDSFKKAAGAPGQLRQAINTVIGVNPQFKAQVAVAVLPPKITSNLPSMPAPGPAIPEIAEPVSAPVAKAPAKGPSKLEQAEQAAADQNAAAEPTPEAPTMAKVHQGATYGEPLLREILGAKPVDDFKDGR
jgi:DNA polymerase-3 subunit gamma/tau